MSLKTRAKADAANILSNSDEWGESLIFDDGNGSIVTVNGLYVEHHMDVDEQGNKVIGKNGRVTVSEQTLIDAGYTVRDSNNDVDLKNHKVSVNHQNGSVVKYRIEYIQPDETLGLILCYLGDYATN